MNCAEFSELVFELARKEGLDEATRQKALAHADACPRCDEELVMARSLTDALRTLGASAAGADAPARVEEVLTREMRQWQAPSVIRAPHVVRWVAGGVVGLAATILLSVVLLKPGIVHRGGGAPTDGTQAVAGNSTPSAPAAQENVTGVPQAATGAALPAASHVSTASSPSSGNNGTKNDAGSNTDVQGSDTEYATEYVSLPSADDSTFADDVTIVRVSLPPSALASFGLPVSSDGRNTNVLADFVLGEDGTPQAVRLVQSN